MYFSTLFFHWKTLKNWPICQGAWSPKSCQEFLHQYRFRPIFEATRHAAGQGQRADGGIEALKSSIDLFWRILLPWIWFFVFGARATRSSFSLLGHQRCPAPLLLLNQFCAIVKIILFQGLEASFNYQIFLRQICSTFLPSRERHPFHLFGITSSPFLWYSFNTAGPQSGCGQETQLARCRETYRGSTHVKNGFISLSYMSNYSFGTYEYMSQHFCLYCYTVYTSMCFSIVGLHCHCPIPRHSFTPAKSLGGFVNI